MIGGCGAMPANTNEVSLAMAYFQLAIVDREGLLVNGEILAPARLGQKPWKVAKLANGAI
jgi:hypothetical protein